MENKIEVVRFKDGKYGVRRLPKTYVDMSDYGWSNYEYFDFSWPSICAGEFWWQDIMDQDVSKWIKTRFLWRAKRLAKNFSDFDEGIPINEA